MDRDTYESESRLSGRLDKIYTLFKAMLDINFQFALILFLTVKIYFFLRIYHYGICPQHLVYSETYFNPQPKTTYLYKALGTNVIR